MLYSILFFLNSQLVEAGVSPAPLPEAPPLPTLPNYEGAFLKMFLTLLCLVVAIFFSVWALKKMTKGRLSASNAARAIKILERRPISPKTTLYLIELNGKQALIAESQLEVKKILEDVPSSTEEI